MQQLPAESAPLQFRVHAEIQDMRLAGRHRHDGVAVDIALGHQHQALVTRQQTVPENARAPGEFIAGLLDRGHAPQVPGRHCANLDSRLKRSDHQGSFKRRFTLFRSSHDLDFCSGLRNR